MLCTYQAKDGLDGGPMSAVHSPHLVLKQINEEGHCVHLAQDDVLGEFGLVKEIGNNAEQ